MNGMFEIRIRAPYENDRVEYTSILSEVRKYIENLSPRIHYNNTQVTQMVEYTVYDLIQDRLT